MALKTPYPIPAGQNGEVVKRYLRDCSLRGMTDSTIVNKAWRIHSFLKYNTNKSLAEIADGDVGDYIVHRRETSSPRTVQGDVIELRVFFGWFRPGEDLVPKIQRPKITFPVPLTREEISRLIEACRNTRDRTFIMFAWDTGGRLGELLAQNVGDIHIENFYCHTMLRGKTGDRMAWMIDSFPDLQTWLNTHPKRQDPKSPLFLTFTRYGFGNTRLNERTIQNLCKTLARRAGIEEDRVFPHAFRHARATDKARDGYTEMELRIMFGWSRTSNMPATYIHLSGADVKKKMLVKAGLIEGDEHLADRPMIPRKCTRCGTINAPSNQWCGCGTPLTQEAARSYHEKKQQVHSDEEYIAMVDDIEERLRSRFRENPVEKK